MNDQPDPGRQPAVPWLQPEHRGGWRVMTEQTPTEADVRRIVMDCDDRCQDPKMHDFYMAGGGFRWCWPKFDRTHPADRRTRALLNRYPHNVIGVHVVLFGRGWGIRWKTSQ